jgi:hypothetical protein
MTGLASIGDGTNPPLALPIVTSWDCATDRHGGVHKLVLRFER